MPTHSLNPLSATGQSYGDFQITKYLPLDELKVTLIELVHLPTAARIVYLSACDPENFFCLSFQTLPTSSNGVAHILEHTVLCGSKKFPIKDPFFSMTRRSLNTYMNALTGQDFTCYPAASQVKKDFYHLLEVYLDAVFAPYLRKESFLQEGHRLELSDPQDLDSPLQIKGIVYNEMKGAMNGSDARLWELVHRHLTPDLTYAVNSGGDPSMIPTLSHEELLAFHELFYHPSRCLFFFYGDIPLIEHLDFLEKNVLGSAKKSAHLPLLPQQKRFSCPVWVEGAYPAMASEDPKRALVAISWLTATIAQQEELLALSLLESLLMETDASPLKKALLRSNLCKEADSSLDTEMSEVPFSIVCKGCFPEEAPQIHKLVLDTLKKIVKKGFSKEQIEGSLHQLEFERKEIGAEGVPYGLTLFFRSVLLKQHGIEAEQGMLIHSLFAGLRAKLQDPHFLPSLIEKHLLNNPHCVIATLKADPELAEKEKKEEEERLKAQAALMTKEEKKALNLQAENLARFQAELEHQSIDCLPSLSLSDVPAHGKDFALEKIHPGVYHHSCFTNEILYADLVLELPFIPPEDLPLLSLYSRFLTELGAGGKSYEEALNQQIRYTGGLSASLSLNASHANPNFFRPTFTLRGKALTRHAKQLFELFENYLFSPDLKDKERLQELMDQHLSSLKNRLVKNSLPLAGGLALSPHSLSSAIQNQLGGLPYYKWAYQGLPSLESFERIRKYLTSACNSNLLLTCTEKELASLSPLKLSLTPGKTWENPSLVEPAAPYQAAFIPSTVAFTAQGKKVASYASSNSPALLLATELLSNTSLHATIREKGGAYGSGANYNPAAGTFYLYAFRDPHLAATLKAFDQALHKIGCKDFSERELKEAKLGALQSIDAPVSIGNRAATAFSWQLTGRTREAREAFRKTLLTLSREEVASSVSKELLSGEKTTVTFLGKELFEHEKNLLDHPFSILPLPS